MEQRSTDLIVIFAGYKDKMDSFFSYIPGERGNQQDHPPHPQQPSGTRQEVKWVGD